MKYLVVGDIHIKIKNIPIIQVLIKELVDIVSVHKPDYMVILGDMADSHGIMHLQAWNTILEFIKSIGGLCKIIYVVGNHDMLNNQQFLNNNNWFDVFNIIPNNIIKVANKPIILNEALFIPFVPTGRFNEALEAIHGKFKIAFCHQEFEGCIMNNINSRSEDQAPDFPVFSGHIHDRQKIHKVQYIGSPLDVTAVSPVDRFVELVEVGDTIVSTPIQITSVPRKIYLEFDIDSVEGYTPPDDYNFYKVLILGKYSEIFKYKQTDAYQQLKSCENVRIVFKSQDVESVRKNKSNSSDFLKIITEEIKHEDDMVQVLFSEVMR